MNITGAKIEWLDDFDSPPTLFIEVDGFLPKWDEYRYEQRGASYFAQHESGVCSFFYYAAPSKDGYGGSSFELKMIDGTKRTLVGPWSGNELGMAAAGFPMTYGCRAKARCTWGDGWSSSYGVYLLEPLWRETIARFCTDAHLVSENCAAGSPDMAGEQNRAISHGLPARGPVLTTLMIARVGMTYAQSQAYKRVNRFSRYAHEVRDEPVRYACDKPASEMRLGHATYVNGLIAEHKLEQWCQPFDLANLPPLLPPRPPEPVCSYNPEDEP